jgi:hypothetical protein
MASLKINAVWCGVVCINDQGQIENALYTNLLF